MTRLLSWCQLQADPAAWDPAAAERCRRLLPQIATAALAISDLPPMFQSPLSRYLYNAPSVSEIIDDDDRLMLMLSDLRDYLVLMKRGYV